MMNITEYFLANIETYIALTITALIITIFFVLFINNDMNNMNIKVFKTTTIKIGVTKPDMSGYFSIFIQIGDEIPIERKIRIDNEKNNQK